jgi:FkbM family methyltransferase
MAAGAPRLSMARRFRHWRERRRTRRALSGLAFADNNQAEGDVDRLVFQEFFDDDVKGRTFVDVGAARPDYLSISALFRKKGWRVIAVEPNPEFASMHRVVGHDVFEYACGREDRDDCEFSVVDLQDLNGMVYQNGQVSFESGSSLAIKPGYDKIIPPGAQIKKIKVRQRRLDSILKEASVDVVDVLSVDVEGWELEVLDGLDFEKWRPKVLIIENYLRDPAYDARMAALGYRLWQSPFPNQVFVSG